MSDKSPAFQWYPKDFLSDERCRLMTMEERGVYITLLSLCWLEKSLPNDTNTLATLIGMKHRAFAKTWMNSIRFCFEPNADGRLIQKRMEMERLKQQAFRDRQSLRGQASAKARAVNRGSTKARSTGVQPRLVQPNGNSSSSSSSSSSSAIHIGNVTPPASAVDKAPADPRIREFIGWFMAEYEKRRNGAKYKPVNGRDGQLVKDMLEHADMDELKKYAQILLTTDDPWISDTERGIGILSNRFSWLSDRYAQWKSKQQVHA